MRRPVPPLPLVLTAPEVAAVVTALEGTACTARRVRYLFDGQRGAAGVVRGQTRLYGLPEVAVMRLVLRLEAQGVSGWVARVVVTYCGDAIGAAWRRGAAAALVVRGVTGTIEPVRDATARPAAACVPLPPVWRGIERAVRAARRRHPDVWRWRQVDPATLTGAARKHGRSTSK